MNDWNTLRAVLARLSSGRRYAPTAVSAENGRSLVAMLALVFLFAAASGCGTGTYNERMEHRLKDLRQKSKFLAALNSTATSVPDTPITLQLPSVFDSNAKVFGPGSKDEQGQDIPVNRIELPGMRLPGFRFSYERFVPNAQNRQVPVYVYLAVVKQEEAGDSASWLAGLMEQILAAYPEGAEDWEEIELDKPSGDKMECLRLSVTAPMEFDSTSQRGSLGEREGRLDLYMASSAEYVVLAGFRAPTEVADSTKLFEAAEASMGTLEPSEGPPSGE